tara:strand:+ start:378 stop:1379 length:1002 start_codon:yes stop_codon:yes gene_type:complete
MKNIFCDGVFDLFHKGHLLHLKKIKEHFAEPIKLYVGLITDEVAKTYKRKPIYSTEQRKSILLSCIYVDKVILMDDLIINKEFMDKHNIDYVFHAFLNSTDSAKQSIFYEIPKKLNKFIEIEYNKDISTTKIIEKMNLDWGDIWEKKGNEKIDDLFLLNGWDSTGFNPKLLITKIRNHLNIPKNNSIIEIGCGSGLLSKYLDDFTYFGSDKSSSLINKHIKILNNIALNFSSDESIFKEKYFDFCICNSMLEYLTNRTELDATINEMEKITKKGIYIGSIRYKTRHVKTHKHKYNGIFNHFVIKKEYFSNRGYTIIDNLFEPNERYDVFKIFQ